MNVFFKDLVPATSCPPDPIQFNDTVTGTVVTMTEWIANELYRLQNNVRPRHCEHYEELVELIQEPKLLDSVKVAPPPLPVYNDQEDDLEYDDDDDNDQEEENDTNRQDNIPAETDTIATKIKTNNIPTIYKSIYNKNVKPSPSTVLLCRVFIEIMRYCGRVGTQTNAPRLLLTEFEKLRQDMKLGNTINAIAFRENLLKILFGKIQMTEHLVKCWKLLCEWVTGTPLEEHQHAMKWIEMSLKAYIAAQRFVFAEHIIMRKYQQEQKKNSDLKIATDIVICKK